MDVAGATSFVEEHGSVLERYRLHFLVDGERDDVVPFRYFSKIQNEDGGFPYDGERGRLSCINDTSLNLRLMIELDLGVSNSCQKAVDYLLRMQGEDGSWSMSEALTQYNPPFWLTPNDPKTTMWLTANVTHQLVRLGYASSRAVQKAAQFLLRNRGSDGKFAGYLHSTWISIGVFGELRGRESEVVKRALRVMNHNLERLRGGASELAWCLECFHTAGVTRENPVVQKYIDELTSLQQENGAWLSGESDELTVSTTIDVLRVLRTFQVW